MGNLLSLSGDIWWARLVIPSRLQKPAGRREFSQSTRTHELQIAKLVAAVLLTDRLRQLLALECQPMTSDEASIAMTAEQFKIRTATVKRYASAG